MPEWLLEHRGSVAWMAGLGLAALVLGAIAAPILIVKLPEDFLENGGKPPGGDHPARRIVRNIFAWILITGGLAMLALPGPGIVVLLVGLVLADFPGKRKLMKMILSRKSILKPMNKLRAKYGKPPLRVPDSGPDELDGPESAVRNGPVRSG